MMMKIKLCIAALVMTTITAFSQTAPSGSAPAAQATKKPTAASHDNEGQRIFEENCSRCHNAPDGFSSHISGTVLRHMRVRASLSKHDEEELLRFFNP